MRAPWFVAVPLVLIASGVCVRLGFWQISRLHEKQALNAALRQAEQAPAVMVGGEPPPAARVSHRSIQVTGRFDEQRQFLLSGRAHDGAPGVEVVTPLMPDGAATAILVNRGWLPAADGASARVQDCPEPGVRTVRGIVEDLQHGAGGPPARALAAEGAAVWSVRWLDADSIAGKLPYAVADYAVRQIPAPGVPDRPRRTRPHPFNEMMHVSYAIQWFLFAGILLGGSASLAWSRRRRAAAPPISEASS